MRRFAKYVPLILSIIILIFSFFNKSENKQQSVNVPAPAASVESKVLGEEKQEEIKNADLYKIIYVVDGDTFEIETGQRVRMIGVDTPETVDPKRDVGCFGPEASNYSKSNLLNQTVRLEKDVSETDKYGRLLRYVWVDDQLFNEKLVREGYASVVTYPPDVKYQSKFLEAQKEARENKRGLWGEKCQPAHAGLLPSANSATPQTLGTSTAAPTQTANSNKTCKYNCKGPDKDCSDFTSHAEAQEFFNCCGFSSENDPMKLDKATGKGNGLACESLK